MARELCLGLSVRWWGRIGKALQALAALAVVLDIVGAERVRQWAMSLKQASRLRSLVAFGVASTRFLLETLLTILPALLFRLDRIVTNIRRCLARSIAKVSEARAARTPPRTRSPVLPLQLLLRSRVGIVRKARLSQRLSPTGRAVGVAYKKYALSLVAYLFSVQFIVGGLHALLKKHLGADLEWAASLGVWLLAVALTLAFAFPLVRVAVGVLTLIVVAVAYASIWVFIELPAALIAHRRNDAMVKLLALVVFGIGFHFDLLAS